VCRSIKLTSLRDASEDFEVLNIGPPFCNEIEEDWGHKVCGLVLGYDQNVHIANTLIKLQNGLLYNCQPCHNPTSVELLGLDCKIEYTNANQGILPAAYNIWVHNTKSEENDFDTTIQGGIPAVPVFYFRWTLQNQIIQFQTCLPAGKPISTLLTGAKRLTSGYWIPKLKSIW
jgi:hypothetical protein